MDQATVRILVYIQDMAPLSWIRTVTQVRALGLRSLTRKRGLGGLALATGAQGSYHTMESWHVHTMHTVSKCTCLKNMNENNKKNKKK